MSRGRGFTVFLPDEPATRGHVLLVPNEHVADVWSLTQGMARDIASEVLRVAGAVREAIQPDGVNIIQSNGAAASQSVDHLHVHVLPRWAGDVVGEIWPPSPAWSTADLDSMRADLERAADSSTFAGYDLGDEQDREDRRKHLELVSNVINRMAGSSATAKGWSMTLAGAAFGLALVRDSWPLILLGLVVLTSFGILDARYLDNERRARDVYERIAADNAVVPFSLRELATPRGQGNRRERLKAWLMRLTSSWSIRLFYGPLIAAGLALLIVAVAFDGVQ